MSAMQISSKNIFPCVGACMITLESSNTALVGIVYPIDGSLNIRFMPIDTANALLGMLSESIEAAIAQRAGCRTSNGVTSTRLTANIYWRSANDELPMDDGEVLVAIDHNGDTAVAMAYCTGENWFSLDHFPLLPAKVTHWAVLPESPQQFRAKS